MSGPSSLDSLLGGGDLVAAYQPIVELGNRTVVGWEALARLDGGERSGIRPDLLFELARSAHLTGELDWQCRAAAARGALAAGICVGRSLFINVEPAAMGAPCPDGLEAVFETLDATGADVVVEFTERDLARDPAELLAVAAAYRRMGWRIALDDVGAESASLALLPFLSPEVIKLDLRLIQERHSVEIAEVVNAVLAEAERSGAQILAEGIETESHLTTALAIGATLGQGWLLGRPGPLPDLTSLPRSSTPVHRSVVTPVETPIEALNGRSLRIGSKRLILSFSELLEAHAFAQRLPPVLLSCFEDADHFTPRTRERYGDLGEHLPLVGALGTNMDPEPAPGVRGAHITDGDALARQWNVLMVSPHFCGALIARDLGDAGPDMDRRFEFDITYDRDIVVQAARSVMRRLEPAVDPPFTAGTTGSTTHPPPPPDGTGS